MVTTTSMDSFSAYFPFFFLIHIYQASQIHTVLITRL